MNFNECKVMVIGSGVSGIGATQLLLKHGATVILSEGNTNCDLKSIYKKVGRDDFSIVLGALNQETFGSLDLVVLSPGVPTDLPCINVIRDLGIPIWGEVELAFAFDKGQVMAITGTNGKTTTTALLGNIMKEHMAQVFVVGNIGIPYTQSVEGTNADSLSVAELSSFQLETIHDFKPKVSGMLNLTPDHLNRHHTMEAYAQAKMRIAINQDQDDFCVLNYEDESLRKFGETLNTRVLYFSSQRKLEKGMYLSGDEIIFAGLGEDVLDGSVAQNQKLSSATVQEPEASRLPEGHIVFCKISDLKLLGVHNYENVMAAALMTMAYGVSVDTVRKAVFQYQGVEHRIEFVCERNKVAYYNDSKGTNPAAAIKAIEAMVRPTILIGGGYDKESEFDEWISSFDGKVRHFILTGETRFKIADTAKAKGIENVHLIEDFTKAVELSVTLANPGEAVLLSPACASWGQFKNYEERGDKFKAIIKSK